MLFKRFFTNRSCGWFRSRNAAALFGFGTVMLVLLTALSLVHLPRHPGNLLNLALAVVALPVILSIAFLWSGMWHYFVNCDSSSRRRRTLLGILLIAGLPYGAALYYLLVYLPRRQSDRVALPQETGGAWVGAYGRVLVAAWVVFFAWAGDLVAFHAGRQAPVAKVLCALYLFVVVAATGLQRFLSRLMRGLRREE